MNIRRRFFRYILGVLVISGLLATQLLPGIAMASAPANPLLAPNNTQAGVIIQPTSGLVTSENGDTATFTIALSTRPGSAVKINLESSDPSEGILLVTSVTLNPGNWDIPQPVTVVGVDDIVQDGDVDYTIITSAAISNDSQYNGLEVEDVSVTNLDNDFGPVANDDSATTATGKPVTIDVLANDTGLASIPLTLLVVSQPDNGAAMVNLDLTITYTPQPGFEGTDEFEYTVCDLILFCDTAKVTVKVVDSSGEPIASDDEYTVDQDTTLSQPAPGLLSNDYDEDGTPLSAEVKEKPQHGDLNLNSDGSFTYTPAAGFTGVDTFTYEASNGTKQSEPATVQITVRDTQAPHVVWIAPVAAEERFDVTSGSVTLEVTATDNVEVARVHFYRWDALGEQYVEIADAFESPFQAEVFVSQLNLGWNQIFVVAYDSSGNTSIREFIWLYRIDQEASLAYQIFLPGIRANATE